MDDNNSAGPDKSPKPLTSLGSQYMAKGHVGPLATRLVLGEINKEEYDRLYAEMSLWQRIRERSGQIAETFFWIIALVAIFLNAILT